MQDNETAKVVVVGQGYVGLPLAMRAVEVGYHVVGFDTDSRRVELLRAGVSYVEDISADQLAKALATERYRPTQEPSDLDGFDVALITVPTPLNEGAPDLSYIEEAGRTLATYLKVGAVVVLESTTYPGTTDELLAGLLADHSGLVAGKDFHLGYSPERIDPGNHHFGLVDTPKVVSGVTPASLNAVQQFYDSIVNKTIAVSRPREAELTKLIENTFRHVNVALVNELAIFAADLGWTSGKHWTPQRLSRSALCGSTLARAWEVTAFQSTRATFPGMCARPWDEVSALSNLQTTSTTICRITSCSASHLP